MFRRHKYLSTADEYSYLFDHTKFTIFTRFDRIEYDSWFDYLFRQSYSHVFINSYLANERSAGKMFLKRNRTYYFLTYYFHFTFSYELFEFYKDLYGIGRYTSSSYRHDNNVIPTDLRLRLHRDGINDAEIRRQGFDLFLKRLGQTKTGIQKYLYDKLQLKIKRKHLKASFQHVEACNDIITAPRVELAEIPEIVENFKREVDNWKLRPEKWEAAEGDSFSFTSGGTRQRQWLTGKWADGAEEKQYLKESGREGATGRAETKYPNKKTIGRVLKTCASLKDHSIVIRNEKDFIAKMNALGNDAFSRHLKIYNVESSQERKERYKTLREFDYVIMLVDPMQESNKVGLPMLRRLYYVAATRAKKWLGVIYRSGKPGRVLGAVIG